MDPAATAVALFEAQIYIGELLKGIHILETACESEKRFAEGESALAKDRYLHILGLEKEIEAKNSKILQLQAEVERLKSKVGRQTVKLQKQEDDVGALSEQIHDLRISKQQEGPCG